MSLSEKKYHDRQEKLEEIARSLLVEDGMSGFSIERIASRSGYSRPTVYQHFQSKDDALEAVASSSIHLCHKMVTRSLSYEGSAWRRAIAIILSYEQIAHFHPTHFHTGESLSRPWIARRLPENVQARHAEFVDLCIGAFTEIFQTAQAQGDLILHPEVKIRQLTFHTIATMIGVYSSIVKNRIIFRHADPESPWLDALQCISCLWEGHGWKTHEEDLTEIYDSVMRSCFPDYWVKAQTEILSAQVNLQEPTSEPLAPAG